VAVVIRLQRAGGRNAPFYRVVASDSRRARDGRFIERVGYYNPLTDPIQMELDVERIQDWVAKGARLSETVTQLLKRYRLRRGAQEGTEKVLADTQETTARAE
jgi:small subunit ribosomal protein S16